MAYNFVFQVKNEIRQLARKKGIVFNDDTINRIVVEVMDNKKDIIEAVNNEIECSLYHITRERKPVIKEKEKKKTGRKPMTEKRRVNFNFTEEEWRFLEYLKENKGFTTITNTIRYCINEQRKIKRNFKDD